MDKEHNEELQKKALEQLKSGKSLFGKDGAFAPLLKNFIDKALDAEMEGHLDDDQRKRGNKRNGKGKTIFVSNIITGYQKTQKSAITPFRQMQSAFDRDSLIAKKITIVGYSFNDEHINESIRTAFKYNQELKIAIIEPKFISDNLDLNFAMNIFPIADKINVSDSKNSLYSYLNNRIKVYTMNFSDFLKIKVNARK